MGVLQRFEQRIEELVNRPFARAFKAEVQPVEIASALQRECDDRAAIVARGRTMVPNSFTVALGEHDHERLDLYREALREELAAMVREHAEEQRYAFIGPVTIDFVRDDELSTGRFQVRSAAVAGATGRTSGTGSQPVRGAGVPWVEVGDVTYALARPVTRIGRGEESDLRIDDPGISRDHAELRRSGGDVTVVDLGSTNGVVIEGERVEQARLRDGNRLVLGSTTVVFHAGGKILSEMSELTLTVIRLAFLAVLWMFVLTAVSVMRSDLSGRRATNRPQTSRRAASAPSPRRERAEKAPKPAKGRRGVPTTLVVTQGALSGTTVRLGDQPVTLGRSQESTIVLDDDYVSGRHARFFPRDGHWYVEDAGSTNGTYIERTKVTAATPVKIGVPVRIGKTVVELRK